MNEKRWSRGFTMAELLIVVAIIAVLGAVGFVAVQNYQRGMAQLECDTIAKEIFVAAQNHLTMAESQGYLGLDDTAYGHEDTDTPDEDTDIFGRQQVYHYTVNGSGSFSGANMLNLMLPFGAIDETVRLGGSYIIRYQPKPARVLDVFYCSTTDPRFKHTLKESEYNTLLNIRGTIQSKKDARKNYANAVVGWFGGEGALKTGDYNIVAPEISVENAEQLVVTVTDSNTESVSIRLIVSSKDARADTNDHAKLAFDLVSSTSRVSGPTTDGKYTIVLDNITAANEHFAELNDLMISSPNKFIPGEDIVVQAVAYSNSRLSNIAYSAEITVNSLFADLVDVAAEPPEGDPGAADDDSLTPLSLDETPAKKSAAIACFRHLENLDESVSGVDHDALHITQAKQVADLDWHSFSEEQIYYKPTNSYVGLNKGCYKPVNADYLSLYDGGYIESGENLSHSITGIKVDYAGNAGLFGTFDYEPEDGAEPAKITSLKLIDFEINSTGGDVGALAGMLTNTTVSNVLAYHNNDSEQTTITASGDAGGLVGSMTGGQIEQSAAALYVHAGANAGGLVGKAENAAITASYSGGHTREGAYSENIAADSAAANGLVNVIGGTNAGGLVGYASNTQINSSYSTCSASGTTAAGGLIGSVDSATGKTVTVNYCYAAGLVKSDAHAGTFLGQGTLAEGSKHYYFVSGINGIMESGCGATPLANVGGDKELLIPAKGESSEDKRAMSEPFDAELRKDDVGIPYTYPTIQQICAVSKPKDVAGTSIVLVSSDFINKHYGDWQESVTLKTGLQLINAEKLTAKVSFPVAKLDEGQMVTMLIHGTKDARLVFAVEKMPSGGTDYQLTLREASGTAVKDGGLTPEGWLGIALDNVSLNAGNIMFSIDIDDITTPNGHFSELFPEFLPGEDIIVAVLDNEATLDEMKALAENKAKWTENEGIETRILAAQTNSLFAEIGIEASKTTASIKNFRHLENLDAHISGLGKNSTIDKKITITHATQIADMDWANFLSKVGGSDTTKISIKTVGEESSKDDCYLPVNPSHCNIEDDDLKFTSSPLIYDGRSSIVPEGATDPVLTTHKIIGVKVDCTGNAGLFGSMVAGSSVSNLELIDFSVTGTGDAGALAGTLTGTSVTNVLARNSTKATDVNVSATSGDAGGLIGSMSGSTIEKCAAAVIVNGGNAGGLIGTASNGATVSASYSGGHTSDAAYTTDYNVTASGKAGGLIGDAGNATITNSYSTCSATGGTAGGFVGTSSGSISNCYATGLVSGTTSGAFAGSLSNATNCLYYEIINEGMPASGSPITGITALDANVGTYDAFVGSPTDWKRASAYDKAALDRLFGEDKYSMKTVSQLGATVAETDFVATHYGDWPAPELLVVNED